jgi:hypothetical protein
LNKRAQQLSEAGKKFRDRLLERCKADPKVDQDCKVDQNLRKFLSRRGWTRRVVLEKSSAVLGACVGASGNRTPPLQLADRHSSIGEREEQAWREFLEVQKALFHGKVRLARRGASQLKEQISLSESSSTLQRIAVYCDEVTRYLGGPSFETTLRQSRAVTEAWIDAGDPIGIATALLAEGNLWRSAITVVPSQKFRRARTLTEAAHRLATTKCRKQDQRLAKILEHQALVRRHRLIAFDNWEPQKAAVEAEQIGRLAEEINHPAIYFETFREESGRQGVLGDFDEAESLLLKARIEFEKLPAHWFFHFRYGLLHSEIELLRSRRRRYEAEEKIDEYLQLFKRFPTPYRSRLLRNWGVDLADISVFSSLNSGAALAVPLFYPGIVKV